MKCNYEETQCNCFISYPILYIEPRKHLTLHRDKWIFLFPFSGSANFKGKTSIWNVYLSKYEECFGCCNNYKEMLKQQIT